MYQTSKRLFDITVAAACLLITAPIMLVLAAAVCWRMGRPLLFRQRRPGLDERVFTCYKFRTMTMAADKAGRLLSDAERLTGLGHFLRRTSLDELPQLWNILIGDLSLVGPRPLLETYLPYYTAEERRRHTVRPGLTGWAQIHNRNSLPFDERLRLDLWYVDHMSWSTDLKIIAVTIWIVLTQRGYAADELPLDQLREHQRSCTTVHEVLPGVLSSAPKRIDY